MRHVLPEFIKHYGAERPHQGVGNVSLPEADRAVDEPQVLKFPSGEVMCRQRLGDC